MRASENVARIGPAVALTKLQQDSAIVEDVATELVQSLTRLDRGVKVSEPARQIEARITDALLRSAIVMEKLCFEMITILNEL